MNIRRLFLVSLIIIFIAGHSAPAAEKKQVPHEINGFRLDASIDEYDFISNRNYLKEVVIEDIGGFRKGVIYYGTCKRPGRIVKIQLKYKDPSREFYKQLLSRYTKKFGKPDEFTGDPFGTVLEWKWRFIDEQNRHITLTLQHNLKNIDENIGNQVKLSMPERLDEERLCFQQECDRNQLNCPAKMMREEWENLIPR